MDDTQVVVVGAGAAGLLAGIFAARTGARTLVLETRPKLGAKIRVSGGGRCNLLPRRAGPEDFRTSGSPRLVRNVLGSWPLDDVRTFFEHELGIALKEEADGKLFPRSERPLDVVEALTSACTRAGASIRPRARVTSVLRDGDGYVLRSDDGQHMGARCVVLATGGLSLPKTGSDGGGFTLAQSLGHPLAPTFPVLVPLRTSDLAWHDLAGISLPATLRVRHDGRVIATATGGFLFTHRGFSGPAVLDVSREIAQPGRRDTSLEAHWGGDVMDWNGQLTSGGRRTVGGVIRSALPRRLADLLLERAGIAAARRCAELSRPDRLVLVRELGACPLSVDGNEGYRTAEATGGGIRLEDLHGKTLESRLAPGLHFAGEMIDVDGRIGGYNFLWAFVSGRRAGNAAGLRAIAPNG